MEVNYFNYLLRVLKYNQKAFTALYNYYFPRIVVHISNVFNDEKLGEDIAQEFFIKLFKMNYSKFVVYPTAWVYKICDNLAKDVLKKEIPTSEYDDNSENRVNFDESFVANCELTEKFTQLNDVTQRIIYLIYWEGYSLKEISELLKIKYSTVRQLYSRGLKKLKKIYEL
jgi:RNA polymerase sigma-70 factor (ECF subfamily)